MRTMMRIGSVSIFVRAILTLPRSRYNMSMREFFTKKRNIGFLLLAVVFLSILSWFIVSFPPDTFVRFILFYTFLFGLSITLCLYIFADLKQSLIVSGSIVMYFLLRSFNLRHPIYGILLFICCLSILRLFSHSTSSPKT